MSTKTPDAPRLRKLLFKFYQENDPIVLQQGFDINGLVKFTSDKGIDTVNRMLFKKYGTAIDVNADLGSAIQDFNRLSQGLTTSTVIVKKEHEFRTKLFAYFSLHDPSLCQASRINQLETLVKFAMLNGLDKLSAKLASKYGAQLEGIQEDKKNDDIQETKDETKKVFGNNGENKFALDKNRLRTDLEKFYTEMEDTEQLEVLEEMTDWACEIGMTEFDKKMQQLYGQGLNAFLMSINQPEHVDQSQIDTSAPTAQPVLQEQPVVGVERPFNEMSDDDIKAELREFYEKHDSDNLANLDRVLGVARKMGRVALNANLLQIYKSKLSPIAGPAPTERVDVTMPQQPVSPTFSFSPPVVQQQEAPAPVEDDKFVPEFMRKARAAKERTAMGKSRVTGPDGKVIEVNILIDVCKNYALDALTGLCGDCGFAVSDHFYGIKKR